MLWPNLFENKPENAVISQNVKTAKADPLHKVPVLENQLPEPCKPINVSRFGLSKECTIGGSAGHYKAFTSLNGYSWQANTHG